MHFNGSFNISPTKLDFIQYTSKYKIWAGRYARYQFWRFGPAVSPAQEGNLSLSIQSRLQRGVERPVSLRGEVSTLKSFIRVAAYYGPAKPLFMVLLKLIRSSNEVTNNLFFLNMIL